MYIFGYFFQNGHFKALKNKGTLTKNIGKGGADDPLANPLPPLL